VRGGVVIRPPTLGPDEAFPGEALMKGGPVGRAGSPSAIAAAADYLASDDAAFVHGTVIDGGRTGVAVTADAWPALGTVRP
jgi:NAD(P)-dependent dehydrogenase (short-subunit alcohol dehydrogenase family)